jgi:hypothetical protein
MTREMWGYLFWGISLSVFVGVPELLAAFGHHVMPFPTLSETVRDLERRYSWTQLVIFAGMATLTVHFAFPALFEKVGLASVAAVKKVPPRGGRHDDPA